MKKEFYEMIRNKAAGKYAIKHDVTIDELIDFESARDLLRNQEKNNVTENIAAIQWDNYFNNLIISLLDEQQSERIAAHC